MVVYCVAFFSLSESGGLDPSAFMISIKIVIQESGKIQLLNYVILTIVYNFNTAKKEKTFEHRF